ncbi:unnamed protein product, partial [Ixodes pacificus]
MDPLLINLLINNGNLGEAEAALESDMISPPEHPYNIQRSDARLIPNSHGSVKKVCLKTKCRVCMNQLLLPAPKEKTLNAAVFTKSCNFGGLLYPSVTLFKFVSDLEDIFTGCFSSRKLHHNSG